MGNRLFGIDIAGLIAKNVGKGVLPCTLTVITKGDRKANPTAGRETTEQSIQGRGFIEEFEDKDIDGTKIKMGDKWINLIADTFAGSPVPKIGNKITIEGKAHEIVGTIERDPAAAIYKCHSRGL
jgi:hypothetical protein